MTKINQRLKAVERAAMPQDEESKTHTTWEQFIKCDVDDCPLCAELERRVIEDSRKKAGKNERNQ